jgi:hypothetical protein
MKIERARLMAVAAVAMCIAFAYLVSARASAEEGASCDMYGIHVGADGGDAHMHFTKNQKGWALHEVSNEGDGWISIEYRQQFKANVHGSVTLMILNGKVDGIFSILYTPEANDVGLLDIATVVTNLIGWEARCEAEVSRFVVDGTSSYYAEGPNGTSRLYRFENSGGITSVIITQGPTRVVYGILQDALLEE